MVHIAGGFRDQIIGVWRLLGEQTKFVEYLATPRNGARDDGFGAHVFVAVLIFWAVLLGHCQFSAAYARVASQARIVANIVRVAGVSRLRMRFPGTAGHAVANRLYSWHKNIVCESNSTDEERDFLVK